MTEETDCRTNTIDDAPASDDWFGAHGRIAQTIARLIDESAGGKTVGLSGTWGSGKSTVVRLLEKRYRAPHATTLVWTFDAWAHEGDPLRRTFLERLVARLAEQGWLTKSRDWQRDLDTVARRRKWSLRRQAPRLTPIGVVLAISLLLVPIGSALFTNQIRNGVLLDPAFGVDRIAVLGVLLILAPLIAPAIAALLWLPFLAMKRNREEPLARQLLDAVSVFVQRGDTGARIDTLESGDQTTLEFEALFGAIMKAAVEPDSRRRLVIVIDNLDRVGAAQALAIWSTLQTFLHARHRARWEDQVWYLVPFDADAIRRLWQKDGAGTAVAESFLDKTFQLRFEVPLPRLANWKDYLTDRLAHALPDHASTDEFFRIYRLYSVRRTADWTAPTPRQLKLFVNQIASLHRQWRHEIPLTDLAYYVLLQADNLAIVKGLLAGELPGPGETTLLSDRVRLNLAALVYGSDIEDSHELLLRQPILDALEAGSSDGLNELARVSDTFWLVLELAVEQGCQEWTRREGGLVLHAAAALDGSSIAAAEPARASGLMRRLCKAVGTTQAWAPMDARAIDGAIVLARHDAALATLLHDSFVHARLGEDARAEGAAIEFARDYARLSVALGVTPATRRRVPDSATYCAIARTLASADAEGITWPHFVPDDEAKFIADYLDQPRSPGWGDVVRVASAAGLSSWEPMVKKAKPVLTGTERASEEERLEWLVAVHAASHAASNLEASNLLNELTDAYTVAMSGFDTASDRALQLALAAVDAEDGSGDARLGAWVFTMLTRHSRPGSLTRIRRGLEAEQEAARQRLADQYERADARLVQAVAHAAIRLGDARRLMASAAHEIQYGQSLDRAFVREVLLAMAELGAPTRVLPASLLIEQWDPAFTGWSRYELARALQSRRGDVGEALMRIPFDAKLATMYTGALDAPAQEDDALPSFCASGLASVEAATWLAFLQNRDGGLPLLHAALVRRGTSVALTREVTDALRSFVTAPPEQPWMPSDVATAVMGVFEPSERTEILESIVADLVAEADRLSLHGRADYPVRAFSHAAQTRAILAGRALFDADTISGRPHVFPALIVLSLERLGDESILWLEELTRAQPMLAERLLPDTRLALHTLVKARVARATGPTLAALIALAGALAGPMQTGAGDPQAL